jgi:hypothetical protein
MSDGRFSNPTTSRRSVKSKSSILFGLSVFVLVVILTPNKIQASSFFSDLDRDLDEGIDIYQQGSTYSRAAGISDYLNSNNECPSGHSIAYCGSWGGVFVTGFNARKTIDESGGQSGDGDNNSDEDNDDGFGDDDEFGLDIYGSD